MDRFESCVFSTETLGAGMTALASQQVKSELPEDKDAMLRELKDFKGFFLKVVNRNLFWYSPYCSKSVWLKIM